MNVLVTGVAGFIGSTLALRLLERGDRVFGIDNLNDYYEVSLKEARLKRCTNPRFTFERLDISDRRGMAALFSSQPFDAVVHLAAQAGVRYSIENPQAYIDANLVGFGNVLEGCRHAAVKHLVFASSSSVYGANTKMPFSEHHNVDHPVSLYGATKKANELMAHAYANLYHLPCTGLRFFTVYGPWGRPDMALFKFTRDILDGKPITVFNYGKMIRDFTYVDDIVEGIIRTMDHPAVPNPAWTGAAPDPATSYVPYRIYNIGNNQPVELMQFIRALEDALGRKADVEFLPMQDGDVPATYANVDALSKDIGLHPHTPVAQGIRRFVEWYKEYYCVAK